MNRDDIRFEEKSVYNVTNLKKNLITNERIKFNAAVNYWFTPLFQKEFPCATCRKYINSGVYKEILGDIFSLHIL
jgi:hypothetical protein